MIHPSPEKIRALAERWRGQEARLERIAEAVLAGEDWTRHLRGLPFVEEIPPREGEAYGRDLRGADLRRRLRPRVDVARAVEREAGLLAAVALEGQRNNTPLPDASPFPSDAEPADAIALALRRGDRFLVARVGRQAVGCVRWAPRREFSDLCEDRSYAEVSGLAVLPAWRRVGIGSALLAAAEAEATRDGLDWALLRTIVEVGLVPYYESRGWTVRRVRQMTYPEAPTFLDAVMTKRVGVPEDLGQDAVPADALRRVAAASPQA